MKPDEIIASPYEVWIAPVGTAFPLLSEEPGAGWTRLGSSGSRSYSPNGVTAQHNKRIETPQPAGNSAPSHSFSSGEQFRVRVELLDMTLEQYAHAMGQNSVTAMSAATGIPGFRVMGLSLKARTSGVLALMARGPSPYDSDLVAQFEIPRCQEVGAGAQLTFRKARPVGVSVDFLALEDPAATSEDQLYGRVCAQDPTIPIFPSFTAPPSITGNASVGEMLVGLSGTIENGAVSARQWLRDGDPIPGATSSSYTLTEADIGANIGFVVTASGQGVDVTAFAETVGPVINAVIYGALSRAESGAGMPVTGTAISSGDPSGHWQISGGLLYPSVAGDTADLDAGPYELILDDASEVTISIEPGTWDVSSQSEWDFVANQSAAVLAGKNIALRNSTTLNLGITGAFGTPFRRADLRDGSTPLTVKGRLGLVGAWADYCEVDKVQQARGVRGLKLQHLKFTQAAETKISLLGDSAAICGDIVIDDCWISGQVADPNGDYSTSSNYPNNNVDLIKTQGSTNNRVGSISVTNCLLEWGGSLVNIRVDAAGAESVITGNTCRYYYDDALAVALAADGKTYPTTIDDNFIIDCVGLSTDSANPHPDAIRLIASNNATQDWDSIEINRNIILEGTSRGRPGGIFLDDFRKSEADGGDSGRFFIGNFTHNIIALDGAVNSLTIGNAKNCVVQNNTIASFNQASAFTPQIIVGTGSTYSTNGGGNIISDNLADAIATDAGDTTSNNIEMGRNGTTVAYSTLFDGPNFDPETEAEAKTYFNPKAAANGAGAVIA